MLEVIDLNKSFGNTEALRSVSFSVPRGAFTVLIGPSGCGKSTLLRSLLGLIVPDDGRVLFNGKDLFRSDIQRLRHHIGYVIQDGGLFPHLTARQNITLLARRLKRDSMWIDEQVNDLRALTHFPPDALERYPLELSGGQRQRVALMRALILDPDVLLLDEPFGALDPMVRSSLQEEMKQTIDELEKTTVMVTHDLSEAAWFSDDIVLMRDGRIVQRGSLEEMKENPAEPFVAEFIQAQRAG